MISSALDEFIQRRIPFQLGGMSDPFTHIENKAGVTKQYIKILNKYKYPFLISTKSVLAAKNSYLDLLEQSNCIFRISITGIDEANRSLIDKGCPDINLIKSMLLKLNYRGIKTSIRYQPLIPGYEEEVLKQISAFSKLGVCHISLEYLKVSIDSNKGFGRCLQDILGGAPVEVYKSYGSVRVGREYALPLEYRSKWLKKIYKAIRERGMTVGFADNDLLLHSDGKSCCNASDLYLQDMNTFDANIVSLAKEKKLGDEISFSDYLDKWLPANSISTYLNSKARLNSNGVDSDSWIDYLKEMWKGEHGIYSPDYFDGINITEKKCENGLPIYIRKQSSFEKQLQTKL